MTLYCLVVQWKKTSSTKTETHKYSCWNEQDSSLEEGDVQYEKMRISLEIT